MDVSIYPNVTDPGATEFLQASQHLQAVRYVQLFNVLRQSKDMITGVAFWNLSDGYSWLDNFPVPGRKNFPLLFDKTLQPKSAYWRVVSF